MGPLSACGALNWGVVNLGGGIPHLRSPCGGEQPEGNLGTQRVAHGEPMGPPWGAPTVEAAPAAGGNLVGPQAPHGAPAAVERCAAGAGST